MANIYQKAIDEFNKHVEPDLSQAGTVSVVANQPASTAADAAGLVTDFNALLTKLKAAGIMEADAE